MSIVPQVLLGTWRLPQKWQPNDKSLLRAAACEASGWNSPGLKSLVDSSQVRTRSNWKSLRIRSWMSLVSICQHGKQSPNHQNNFVVPMGNYSERSCIMVIPMVIACYQMVIILLQFIQTIFIQIWNPLTQILWFLTNQMDSEPQNEFKD